MLTALVTLAALAPGQVYADGRDDLNLLPQKLVNRNLAGQLDGHRFGTDLSPFSIAADTQIGTQVPLDGLGPTPFHGFFVLDAYLGFAVLESLDINLNVLVLNTTASGGFRVLSDILPGLNAHLHLDIGTLGGDPVRFDFLTPDLDVVTLGEGLLIETVPLEGFRGGLRWREHELQVTFGGRVFWQQDDLLSFTLSTFDRRLGITHTSWFSGFFGEDEVEEGIPPASGQFLTVFGRYAPLDALTFTGELGARLGGPKVVATAALLRADLVERLDDFSVHVGYQFRWYQTGFGPLDALSTPSTLPSVPVREDYYATNAFEFLWATPYFDQWSHTVMLEARYRIGVVELYGELEWWLRFARDDNPRGPRLVTTPEGDPLPGALGRTYYRAGLRLFPFGERPHNLTAFFSNKSVFSYSQATAPVPIRFIDRPIVFVEAEVRL